MDLIGAKSISDDDFCHNDPLLSGHKGIFGQAGGSQGELDNCEIGRGDLFLFFGWFKQHYQNGPNLHHLFGWLQIEKIIKGNYEILKFLSENGLSHPHGTTDITQFKNNTIYIGVGQEFILNAQDNPSVVDWASYLLSTYGRD